MPNRGDYHEDAFLELVHDNRARLRKICRVYAKDADTRQDLYQDILVQLWRALPSYEGDAQAGTWLYRVALNTALDYKRRQDVRREATLDETSPLWQRGSFARPDDRAESEDATRRLYAAIGRLGDVDKALVMMYLDGKSYTAMSEVLGISENYVGVKLHRIKKKLAGWLAEVPTL